MATKTSNYEFNKPEQNDFYDVDVQNENWDKVDEELSEFDDSGVTEDIKSFPDFLSKFVTGNKVAITLRNLKAGLQFVLHAGQIVNNCVTDNTGLPLSAAQGKALKDLIDTTNNNLSNKFKITADNGYTQLSQLMDVGAWSEPFVFDIPYTSSLAPASNNAVGIAERGMLHAFDYAGKHFYCIDASKGWQKSPYALKSDLLNLSRTFVSGDSFSDAKD